MKRILTSLLMVVGMSIPFGAPLTAQTHTAVADIPFAFVVSGKVLPAGKYSVGKVFPQSPVFQFRGPQRQSIMVQMGQLDSGQPDRPSLTFVCRGHECVLAKVTPPDSLIAYSVGKDSVERSLHYKIGVASMISVKLGR